MFSPGETYKDIKVQEFVGAGGQGEVYSVRVGRRTMALKLFHEKYSEASDEERVRSLVGKRLWTQSSLLRAAPQRVERIGSRLAHLSEFITGPSIESMIEQSLEDDASPWSFPEGFQLAVSIAQGVSICEKLGIAIGDIAASNLKVVPKPGLFEIYLIDLDNYSAAGQPPPRMLGQPLYLAPELISGATIPTVESDRYALGVLLHEILLLTHPKAGHDSTPEKFNMAVEEGRWHQDPLNPRTDRSVGGYPAEVLTPAVHRLFRRAQAVDHTQRPSSKEWVQTLWKVLDQERGPGIYRCEACDGCFLSDITKDRCPYCGVLHPVLGLQTRQGLIPLDKVVNPIGRGQLGGSHRISKLHIIIRRIGPEYLLENVSSSGTWRHRSGQWVRVPLRVLVPITPGERLRIGDAETQVVVSTGTTPVKAMTTRGGR